MKKTIGHIIFIIGYIFIIWLVNDGLQFARPADYPEGLEYAKAEVVSIIEEDMGVDPDYNYIRIGKQKLQMRIISGKYEGKVFEALNYVTRTVRMEAKPGMVYITGSYDGYYTSMIMYRDRSNILYILAALFVGMVVLFGRRKGVAAIAALVITLVNVVFLFMPLLINGVPAVIAAIIVVLLSTLYTMIALNGICRKSMIVSLCCTLCTGMAGLLAYVVGIIGDISTLNTSEAEDLLFITESCSFRIDNLLVAGILISAMGAVMDTSMSLVSSLYEIKQQNPSITNKELFNSGMNIGKDIMGTMTNTLVLAFVGASINSVMIYYMYTMPYVSLINTDFIVVEVIKGLIGSMAVIISVPMAAILTVSLMGTNKKKCA